MDYDKLIKSLRLIHNYKLINYINYKQSDDKKRCLYGELLVNYVINTNFKNTYFDKQIIFSDYGKPLLACSNLHFNISHSGNWVICCVSDNSIGVDIEKITNFNWHNISKRFFSDFENKYISNSKNSLNTFFKFWTMKEAVIKYYGRGVDSTIKNINFFPINNNLSKAFYKDTICNNIFSFYIEPTYIISVYANIADYTCSFNEVDLQELINII